MGGQRFGVFIYPKPDEEAAAHYSAVRSLLRQREQMTAVYMFMALLDAVAGTRKGLAAEAACALASLEFDDVTTRNGRPERSLRFWAHERGAPRAFLFTQSYDPPARGRPFGPRGSLTLLRAVDPLFPS